MRVADMDTPGCLVRQPWAPRLAALAQDSARARSHWNETHKLLEQSDGVANAQRALTGAITAVAAATMFSAGMYRRKEFNRKLTRSVTDSVASHTLYALSLAVLVVGDEDGVMIDALVDRVLTNVVAPVLIEAKTHARQRVEWLAEMLQGVAVA
jgi:hypothetical protein